MANNIIRDEIKNILVVNLGGVGDIIMATPALKSLRHLYPGARITIWVVPRAKEVLEGLNYCDEIVSFDFPVNERRGLGIFLNFKKIRSIISFIVSLSRRGFDMTINMRPLISFASALKMAAIFGFIGSKYRVGRDTEKRGFFLTHKLAEKYISQVHEVEHQLNLVKVLGGDIESLTPEIQISQSDVLFAKDFLSANNIGDSDVVIGINPGAPWPSKRWPVENFTQVISALAKKPGHKIIITGSPEEGEIAAQLKQINTGSIIDGCGKTSLKQLAALISRFNLYITNDTGPMHIAASLGVPIVAIFKPGHTERNRPYMDAEKYIILSHSLDCAPCQRVNCASLECLRLIAPEEVLKASVVLLERFKPCAR